MEQTHKKAILIVTLASMAGGCSDEGGSGGAAGAGGFGGGGVGGDGGSETVTIEFEAVVGSEAFVCGQTYDGLGANGTSLQLSDFRFYVQDIELKTQDGQYVPVRLDESPWQLGETVLLDFENGCTDLGNVETNRMATGTIPTGDYDGIRFKMGVPFEQNHANPATAPSPLNLTSMHWNWQGGYKFLRLDSGTFSMNDWRMHLGSTGCNGDPVSGGTTECSGPNRVEVEIEDFNAAENVVLADFAALVAGAALDENQAETPVGCMSGPMDGDCAPLFDNLGLSFGGSEPSGPQTFFSVE